MTEQEAINILHPDTTATALYGYSREAAIEMVNEACVIVCDATKKQIPAEPKRFEEFFNEYYCPVCGKRLIPQKYCGECGQRIDWSEVK